VLAVATFFADDDRTGHFHACEGFGHGVRGVVMGSDSISSANPPASSRGGCLGYPKKI
jgi:hypothetical protein